MHPSYANLGHHSCEIFPTFHVKKTRLLFFAPNRLDYTKIGRVPSVVFYGTDKLRADPAIDFQARWQRNRILRWVWFPFERYLIYRLGIGFRLDQALAHILALRQQDVIFAETDSCGLPILLLKRIHVIEARVGFNSAGLINNLETQKHTLVFRWYKWLLQAADFIVCWSPLEEQMFRRLTGARAHFVLLEADTTFYQPSEEIPKQDFVLCVGRDVGRDFNTLFKALALLQIPAKVITSAHQVAGMDIPENVELHTEKVEYETLMDWYRQARLVVVNLQEIHRFTGQRALLEALAMGKATIVAKTRSLVSTYPLKDGFDVSFYQPGNAMELQAKIEVLYSNRELRTQLGLQARFFIESLPKNSYYLKVRQLIEGGTEV